jgi:hypothetical protein
MAFRRHRDPEFRFACADDEQLLPRCLAAGTYQLNHFPLAWDTTGQSPANAIQITEKVKLTDKDHMIGTFTLKVYVWTTPDSLDVAPGGPVATVTGTITATRVTIYSTVPGA